MATYSMVSAATPPFMATHQFIPTQRVHFNTFEPSVTATTTTLDSHSVQVDPNVQHAGSDCGSSSGLGGMKAEGGGGSEDSGSNGHSTGDDAVQAVVLSSKQSATSSGKGSSTGGIGNKTNRISSNRQSRPFHFQVAACTSGSTDPSVHTNHSNDTHTNSIIHPIPIYSHHPVEPSHHLPPSLYTMTVSAAGQLVDICHNNNKDNNARMVIAGQMTTNMTNSTEKMTNSQRTNTSTDLSTTGGGRNSSSLCERSPHLGQKTNVGVNNGQRTGNDLYVHVQLGETLAIRVGVDIQQISGPATVRMVSLNGMAPSALPLHVPPGHMIQQIVDEHGILRHLILSPETSPTPLLPNGPFCASIASTPLAIPSPCATPIYVTGGPATTTGRPTAFPSQPSHPPPRFIHSNSITDELSQPSSQPIYNPGSVMITCRIYCLYHVEKAYEIVNIQPNHWSPPPENASHVRSAKSANEEEPDVSQTSQSESTSCVEDEETERIREMLNRIQSPRVLQVGSREAEIGWQELDTSEASAPGGPFPQIDASEFTYEVVVSENKPDDRVFSNYRCTPEQGNQLRLYPLKPATDYFVSLRAFLPERSLLGDQSIPIGFKTKSSRPDRPSAPKLQKKAKSWLSLHWRRPCENGAKIGEFKLEMQQEHEEGEEEMFELVYSGMSEQTKVSHLHPSTLYRFRLSCVNEHGQSEFSDQLLAQTNGTAPCAPDPPQLLRSLCTSLQLAWTRRAGDDYFSLHMDDPNTAYGFLPICANTTDTVTTVGDLRRNGDYRFRLFAHNDDGQSQPSDIVVYSTLPDRPQPPAKPYLKDRVKATSISLVWEVPRDTGGTAVTSYVLDSTEENGRDPDWKQAYVGAGRTAAISGLDPGRTYLIRLAAVGPAGQSDWSEPMQVSTTVVPPGPCVCPELIGKSRQTIVHIRWAPPSCTGGAPIIDYEVSLRDSVGPSYRGPRTECQLSNLSPGRTYFVRVRAYNRVGSGGWSPALKTVTAAAPPDAVQQLAVVGTVTASTVHLVWNVSQEEDNGAPILEYNLARAEKMSISLQIPDESTLAERRASAHLESITNSLCPSSPLSSCEFDDFKIVHSGPNPNADVANLRPATDYAFKIAAVNSAGIGAWSSPLIVKTAAGPPSSPFNMLIEPFGTDRLNVQWDESECHGSVLVSYLLQVDSDQDRRPMPIVQLPGHISHYLLQDLLPETVYRVRVCSTNDIGSGPWCMSSCTTLSLPPSPPNLDCFNVAAQSLKIRWHDAKSSVGDEKYYYYLEKENDAGSYSLVYEGDGKSAKVKNLTESSRYRFRIRASSPSGGLGPWSQVTQFKTGRLPPPSIKTSPRLTDVAPGSYQVEWPTVARPPGLPSTDRIQYRLQTVAGTGTRIGDRPDDWKTVYQGSSQSFTLSGLPPGYPFRVRLVTVRLSNYQGILEETLSQPSIVALSCPQVGNGRQRGTNSNRNSLDDQCSPSDPVIIEPLLSDGHWALLILAGFSILALLLAFFAKSYMDEQY